MMQFSLSLHGALILAGTWLLGLFAVAIVGYIIGWTDHRASLQPRTPLRQVMEGKDTARDHSRPGPRSRLARHPDVDDTAIQPAIERVMPR